MTSRRHPLARSRLPVMLLAAVTVVATLAGCTREHGRVAPTFQRMLSQPRDEPYGANSFFADGRAMRQPPAGTVPRERDLGDALLTTGMANGALATTSPVPVTDALLARGRSRFTIYCAVCHGERADGRSVVGSNMVDCPPPSLLSAPIRALPAGMLYQVIEHGLGRMPPYAADLSVHDRWAVIAYLRDLQRRSPSAAANSSDTASAVDATATDSAPTDSAAAPSATAMPDSTTATGSATGCGRPIAP